MLIPIKYCILCIKRLSPNFASNIKRSFTGINQQFLFPLKIPWFSNDFRKKFNINIRSGIRRRWKKHSRQEKYMFKVNNRNTRTNCEICSRFIRTALEHIRISQNLNMYLETGLNLTSYEFICKSNIYIFIFFFFFSFIEIFQLELYVGSFKYPANIYLFKLNNRHARARCGM